MQHRALVSLFGRANWWRAALTCSRRRARLELTHVTPAAATAPRSILQPTLLFRDYVRRARSPAAAARERRRIDGVVNTGAAPATRWTPAATASSKVQNPRRHTSNQKAGIVSRQPARGRASGITSRARATLGITAARAPPHAGRWESLDTHAGTRASVSRITVTCRVRNKLNNLSIFRPSRGDGDHT